MTFSDILLKLIPFTFFDENKKLTWGLPTEDADRLITGFVLLLIVLTCFWGVKLYLSVRREKKVLHQFETILREYQGNFYEHYYDIQDKINELNNDRLKSAWSDFDNSLVTIGESYRSTLGAEYFFNTSTLITRAGNKFYSAVPSILLGVGLIGTFTGLYYGLMRVDFKDAGSMQILLQAAGAKFAASIWGLSLSLLFTFMEKKAEQDLERELELIQTLLNQECPRALPEESLITLVENSEYQIDSLNSLSLNIAESLGEKINNSLIENLVIPIQNMANNLGGSPENTLYDRLSALAGGIGADFSKNMEELLHNVMQEISKAVGADAVNLKETLMSLSVSLSDLKATFDSQQKQMSENTMSQLGVLNDSINSMVGTLQRQNEDLKNTLGTLSNTMSEQTDSLSRALSQLIAQMDKQSIVLEASLEKISSSAEQSGKMIANSGIGAMENVNKKAGEVMIGIGDKAGDALARIENTMLAQEAHFSSAFENLRNQLSSQSKLLQEVASSISESANIANQKLANGSQAAFSQIQQSLKNVETLISDSEQKLKSVPIYLEKFSSSAETLGETAENTKAASGLLNQAVMSMNDGQIKWNQAIQQSIVSFSQSLEKFSSSLSIQEGRLGDISMGLDRLVKDAQDVCEKLAGSYSQIIDRNNSSANQLENSLNEYLSTFIQKIKSIQEEMSADCENAYDQMSEHFQDSLARLEQPLVAFGENVVTACTELAEAIELLQDKNQRK